MRSKGLPGSSPGSGTTSHYMARKRKKIIPAKIAADAPDQQGPFLIRVHNPKLHSNWLIDKRAQGGVIFEADCFRDLGLVKIACTQEFLKAIYSDLRLDNPGVPLTSSGPEKLEFDILKLEKIGKLVVNTDLTSTIELNTNKSDKTKDASKNEKEHPRTEGTESDE